MTLMLISAPFNPRKQCLRCGRSKADERKSPGDCFSWGSYYETHIFETAGGKIVHWKLP